MSDATSEPADWAQLFHRATSGINLSYPPHPFIVTSIPADSTVVTTAPTASAASGGGGGTSRSSLVGQTGKTPPKKRSRASRRAPTTLLNTDTANFRAMVQQFTGAPTGPYAYTAAAQPKVRLGFGSGLENPILQPTATVPLGQRPYLHRPPEHRREPEVMRMRHGMIGNGMDDEQVMHMGLFMDGMSHGYAYNG